MRATFAIAALAGSAIAAPSYGQGYPQEVKNVHVVVETVVETVYVTEGYEVPKPTPSAVYTTPAAPEVTSVYEAPSSVYVEPKPEPTPEAPKPTPIYEEPKPEPTPEPTPEQPPAQGTGYMAIVSEYRQKMNLKPLEHDDKLEQNAIAACEKGDHVMLPGTYGQVLAPLDSMSNFKHAFVGGWLCEIKSLLPDCSQGASEGWNYEGQTGHADILTSPNYSKIGCNWANGYVVCDLA